ncbi:sensor histidine kinase [Sphingobacterium paucimobilis]|uniref:histidine kinase n=1 Tax=Sphingobacterium paucimobilis HER1398 TaxID=1346330 RepID=U2HQT7_9SPHI|nr:ATP-binding protein [Sphingobacterium paucimobilis]ERJ57645.1 hypothetical protein M472_02580 [Sphingobacterium paucimobilis HER1398]
MQIRTQLTLVFTAITGAILLLFAFAVYHTSVNNREREFYALLEKEAITKANVFLNARVDKQTLQDIYHNNRKILNEVEVAIYDTEHNLLYHDAVDIDFVKETPDMLSKLAKEQKLYFYQDKWQVIGLLYPYEGKDYIVTAAAYDEYGYRKLDYLLKAMLVGLVVALLIIYIAGKYFSRRFFRPINAMTERARNISATNLDLRIESSANGDELARLADTFNGMLDRLESSFDAQKHFVSNIAHELRTPLAAIIAELELSTSKDQAIADYKLIIDRALNDAKRLTKLSNSLLDLAKASYDPTEITFKPTRIDEVLIDALQQVQSAEPSYRIGLEFDGEIEDDTFISVQGNAYLLKVAFANLIDNGCKFSDEHKCTVSIGFDKTDVFLTFEDNGIGISAEDIERIFTPFFRGENKTFTDGNGIGLSLTHKIVSLHHGSIQIDSTPQKGTTFHLKLPHL